MDHKISIVLDKRRQLKNGKFPIKVRVWVNDLKKAKRVTTGVEMTEDDFLNSWESKKNPNKLKGNDRENYQMLMSLSDRAEESAKSLDYFDFKTFEQKLRRKSSDKISVVYHFNKAISEFRKKGRIGAAESYNSALVSLMKYEAQRTKVPKESLTFVEVTPKWLHDYESYMIDDLGRSVTTVAIYTRTLRVIFNNAISDNDLDKRYYPFGKKKYEIPEEKKVKKTLIRSQVELFYHAILPPLQERARDYWFFSYACSGMNFKDIAMLKFENISNGEISYYREKTKVKKRTNKKKITVRLNDLSQKILDKYKTEYRGDKSYVFPILEDGDSPEKIFRKVNNFIRATNQQLKRIAKEYDFPEGFSTYWARHSYATNMINIGASIELISEALNHSDTRVTQNYFDGFEDDKKKEFSDKLMNF
tara:strand:- start:6351 stop:7607 length:1257 start_codon:yes stop_codon:yes gene_type:complete